MANQPQDVDSRPVSPNGRPLSASFALHARLRQGHDYSPTEVLVAVVLAGFMRPDREGDFTCWPSLKTIAAVSGLTERAVWSVMAKHVRRPDPLFVRSGTVSTGRRPVWRYALVLGPTDNRNDVPVINQNVVQEINRNDVQETDSFHERGSAITGTSFIHNLNVVPPKPERRSYQQIREETKEEITEDRRSRAGGCGNLEESPEPKTGSGDEALSAERAFSRFKAESLRLFKRGEPPRTPRDDAGEPSA